MEIRHYVTTDGVDPFQDWLDDLDDVRTRVAVLRRVDRLAGNHFGDRKFCRDGVWELRIDLGPGYRIYYVMVHKSEVLLLCAGSKRTQVSDIKAAVRLWRDYQQRQA